jgi:hypothetical protein
MHFFQEGRGGLHLVPMAPGSPFCSAKCVAPGLPPKMRLPYGGLDVSQEVKGIDFSTLGGSKKKAIQASTTMEARMAHCACVTPG